MKPILAVDVDLTVVDTALPWFLWLEEVTGKGLSYNEVKKEYDFTSFYKDELTALGMDGLEFWRRKNLYDDLVPVSGSVGVLRRLSDYVDIIFVSALKGDHHKSKYNFCKDWFPFMKGLLGTKEKGYVYCNFAVDDRINNLRMWKNGPVRVPFSNLFLFRTPHSQGLQTRELSHVGPYDWWDIEKYIMKNPRISGWTEEERRENSHTGI